MQKRDAIFKMPKARKRRPNLYCSENLSDLDEVWNSPRPSTVDSKKSIPSQTKTDTRLFSGSVVGNFKSKEQIGVQDVFFGSNRQETGTNSPDIVAELDNKPIVMSDGFVYFQNQESLFQDSDELWLSVEPHNNYTNGLLQEFRNSDFHSRLQATAPLNEDDSFHGNIKETDFVPSQEKHCFDKQQISFSPSENNPQDQSTSKNVVNLSPPRSPDILIVRDESMGNADTDSAGSDLDWESLTPPAPLSPSDHSVPDLGNLNVVTPPSDFLLYPYDNMSSFDSLQNSWTASSSVLHQNQRDSSQISLDHVVPDIYF